MAKEKEQTKSAGAAVAESENVETRSESTSGEVPKYLAVFTDGSYPFQIGVAYPQKNGSWLVTTRAMPAPVEGKFRMHLRPKADKPQQQ